MPDETDGSFNRVNYLLRPSKQVERKLIMEALQRMVSHGYPIFQYRYLGFGSIYYADFILFHKYLNIRDMWCVEHRDIPRRMRLNKPYDFVKLFMKPFSEVIASLNRRRPHLVWLDYDEPLNASMLQDCAGAISAVAPGSIIIVTVTAQLTQVERAPNLAEQQNRKEKLAAEYNEAFGHLLDEPITTKSLARNRVPALFAGVLRNQFTEAVRSRRDFQLDFSQLFNYRYADGAIMLTYGGLLDTSARIATLQDKQWVNGPYLITEQTPAEISVPHLTIREKQWLDQHLGRVRRQPDRLAFELDADAATNYAQYYKYYPSYYETLV